MSHFGPAIAYEKANDPLFRMRAYRLAIDLMDVAWGDAKSLRAEPITERLPGALRRGELHLGASGRRVFAQLRERSCSHFRVRTQLRSGKHQLVSSRSSGPGRNNHHPPQRPRGTPPPPTGNNPPRTREGNPPETLKRITDCVPVVVCRFFRPRLQLVRN